MFNPNNVFVNMKNAVNKKLNRNRRRDPLFCQAWLLTNNY